MARANQTAEATNETTAIELANQDQADIRPNASAGLKNGGDRVADVSAGRHSLIAAYLPAVWSQPSSLDSRKMIDRPGWDDVVSMDEPTSAWGSEPKSTHELMEELRLDKSRPSPQPTNSRPIWNWILQTLGET